MSAAPDFGYSNADNGSDSDIVDLAAIRADDELIEDLRAGYQPPTAEQIAAYLAAWRNHTRRHLQ